MRPVGAYWGHFAAKRPEISTNGSTRSESRRWPAPQSASSQTRIADGERLDGHVEEGLHKTVDASYVRPARSIFSNALSFCRSAIAALVRSPWRYCLFRSSEGPPLPLSR